MAGICEAGALAEVSKHGGRYSGSRAVPVAEASTACNGEPYEGLCPVRHFKVTVGSWVEVWPEMRWLELFRHDLCCPPD